MPTETYYHLIETDYPVSFPAAVDPAPVLIDKRTYFDDWIMNRMCAMTLSLEQYIIDNPSIFGE